MSKLRPLPQGTVIKILESNGFIKVRSRKHITFKKTDPSGRVWITWVPHSDEITLFVIQYIIKQTGKPREEFY
ncbi:MAG TPA: type II toxin-antitoxin system HicA family toxin [archaeon]|nr:type II toxin-antitoxin system HicA family toxin [archaeon]